MARSVQGDVVFASPPSPEWALATIEGSKRHIRAHSGDSEGSATGRPVGVAGECPRGLTGSVDVCGERTGDGGWPDVH